MRGDGRQGDHINRDRLDNQRSNLRVVVSAQQNQNVSAHLTNPGRTSRLRGVGWRKDISKWRARLMRDGVEIGLGVFDTEQEAHLAAVGGRKRLMPYAID